MTRILLISLVLFIFLGTVVLILPPTLPTVIISAITTAVNWAMGLDRYFPVKEMFWLFTISIGIEFAIFIYHFILKRILEQNK